MRSDKYNKEDAMFIKISDRRVNLNSIVEYKPCEHLKSSYYYIKIRYSNGIEEDILFDDTKKRDKFLKCLDDNLLITIDKEKIVKINENNVRS